VNHIHFFVIFSIKVIHFSLSGPNVVVFLHGFPEIWYSWRHQIIAVAGAGFRAIAPDYRGYGLSDPPPEPEKTTFTDLLDDLLAILDALALSKVHCLFSSNFTFNTLLYISSISYSIIINCVFNSQLLFCLNKLINRRTN
jgi:pimeloyl-ACP methyl ester carboxylesterase